MRKLFLIVPFFLFLAAPVLAANNTVSTQGSSGNQVEGQQGVTTQTQQQLRTASPVPSGNQVKNQNQEEESLGEKQDDKLQTRSQTATQNMSTVAKQVQLLLQTKTSGEVGEQIRQIAQDQDKAQLQIQNQLDKVDSRKGITKAIIGSDYGAIKSLKQYLEQNQLRIQQLSQLKNKLSNQGDITQVQETIQALTQENTSIQQIITAEEQVKSLFGWLIKLFNK